jgi:hypothetical protein
MAWTGGVLHDDAPVADSDVSNLAASAARWDKLVENHPDMLPHKVMATDLLCKAELALVDSLRPLMIQRRFAPIEHISHAVELYRYQEMPEHRCAALEECLTALCTAYNITLEQLFEFETLAQWARERNSCFHPLGRNALQLDAAAVAEARICITTSPDFEAVRASSLLLVRILEARLPAA